MRKVKWLIPSTRMRYLIRRKTGGRCHVCGGPLERNWHADHVRPYARGGSSADENFLPCCALCNRARWQSGSKLIRRIMRYGIFVRGEVRAGTSLGREFLKQFRKHDNANIRRAISNGRKRRNGRG